MTLATEVDKWKRIRSLLSHEDVRELDRLLALRERVEALAKEYDARPDGGGHDLTWHNVAARLREALDPPREAT